MKMRNVNFRLSSRDTAPPSDEDVLWTKADGLSKLFNPNLKFSPKKTQNQMEAVLEAVNYGGLQIKK